ncbi:hypothetical protein HAZT_HAZT010586 [Hyalella azteca]|uniref:Uncharacterized protein n=1 Tax=Hyalella azteca TaxID=294128 RepID=A0A6A0GWG9_HYAAZ|nr:hypothetical protein HAZT_HAZT010586 [Hyalella azteca]
MGPTPSKTAPLKSKTGEVLADQEGQMRRWTEPYLELSLSIDSEINSRIARAATVMAKLILYGNLLYGCETRTTHAGHERKLDGFHMRCLRRILQIKWQYRVPNSVDRSGLHTQDLLYCELVEGRRKTGRPKLRLKDICMRDLKRCRIDPSSWETQAADRQRWRLAIGQAVSCAEVERHDGDSQRRFRRKQRATQQRQPSAFTCDGCGLNCHSRIGLCAYLNRYLAET